MKFLIVLALFTVFHSSQGASFFRKAQGNICADATHDHYLVPDPTDCHYFYSCVADGLGGFNAHRFKCAANLAFDDNQKQCDYEELVASCRATPTTTTTTTEPTTTTTTPEPTTTTPEPTTTTEQEEPETTTEPEEPETTTEPEEPETTTEPEEPETTTEPEEPGTTTEPEEPETTTEPQPETTTTELLPHTETICENQKGGLSCEGSKTIQVHSAFYGRHDGETCPSSHIQTTSCHSDRLEYVRAECEGKQECRLASNNGFGDPCGGTYKYLQATYYCI